MNKGILANLFTQGSSLPSPTIAHRRQRRTLLINKLSLSKRSNKQFLEETEELMTLKYVQSHHPAIKERVAKIIGESRNERTSFDRKMENQRHNFYRCSRLHCHPKSLHSSAIPFSFWQASNLLLAAEGDGVQVLTSKSCKLTSPATTSRSNKPVLLSSVSKRESSTSDKSTQRITQRNRRAQTANIRKPSLAKSKLSFAGWDETGDDHEYFFR